MSAGAALAEAALDALAAVDGLAGRHEARPLQAAFPYATVETGLETDWSHKSGTGREVRLTVVLRDSGERPVRLRRLMQDSEAALAAIGGSLAGWQMVSLAFVRSRLVPEAERRWTGVLDYRARLLAE